METVKVLSKNEHFEIIIQDNQSGITSNIILSKNSYEQLRQHFIGELKSDSDNLVKCYNCGDEVKMISSGEFCPHCYC